MSAINGQPGPPPGAKTTTYMNMQVAVQPQPNGMRVLIFSSDTEQIVFPMDSQAAEIVGRALLAPGVYVPGPGEAPS